MRYFIELLLPTLEIPSLGKKYFTVLLMFALETQPLDKIWFGTLPRRCDNACRSLYSAFMVN